MATTIVYNVEAAEKDIVLIAGDTIDLSFSVKRNGIAYDMTGMDVNMEIRDRTVNETLVKALSSEGSNPEIIIAEEVLNIVSTGILVNGMYKYDLQISDSAGVFTIMKGNLTVEKGVTA